MCIKERHPACGQPLKGGSPLPPCPVPVACPNSELYLGFSRVEGTLGTLLEFRSESPPRQSELLWKPNENYGFSFPRKMYIWTLESFRGVRGPLAVHPWTRVRTLLSGQRLHLLTQGWKLLSEEGTLALWSRTGPQTWNQALSPALWEAQGQWNKKGGESTPLFRPCLCPSPCPRSPP